MSATQREAVNPVDARSYLLVPRAEAVRRLEALEAETPQLLARVGSILDEEDESAESSAAGRAIRHWEYTAAESIRHMFSGDVYRAQFEAANWNRHASCAADVYANSLEAKVEQLQQLTRIVRDGIVPEARVRVTSSADSTGAVPSSTPDKVMPKHLSAGTSEALGGRLHGPASRNDTDVTDILVVCALHRPELDKVIKTGAAAWSRVDATDHDPHTYHRTQIQTVRGNTVRIIAAAPNHMGLTASTVVATKLIWRFRPRLVVMVGIAAGVRRDTQGFGDIIAADQTIDYGSGKLTSSGDGTEFLPDPRPHPIAPQLLSVLREWERARTALDEIQRDWLAKSPPTQLRLHVGPLASGAAVLNSQKPVDDILRHWRKLAGVEMEAYGVHAACREAIMPEPSFLCLKSVCDFASDKTDDWQDYAAFTAASLMWNFVRSEYESVVPQRSYDRREEPWRVDDSPGDHETIDVLRVWIERALEDVLFRPTPPGELGELLHLPATSVTRSIEAAVRASSRRVRLVANNSHVIQIAPADKTEKA